MKIKSFGTLTFKLTIWYIVILGIIVTLAGAFLYQGFKKSLMEEADRSLFDVASEVSSLYSKKHGVTWQDAIARAEEKFHAREPFIQVIELTDDKAHQIVRVIRSPRVPEGSFLFDNGTYVKADHADWDDPLYLTREVAAFGASPTRILLLSTWGDVVIQVGMSLQKVNGDLNRLTILMSLAGLLLLLFASAGGGLIIRRALSPVKSVVRTARQITADDLSLRIDAKSRKDEIGDLVETFNDMIARLEKSIRKIRQFSGDVSHELRTPLTIIRGEIEVMLRKERTAEEYRTTLRSALEETRNMEKIIDDLLALSRIEAAARMKFHGDVSLQEILMEVGESRSPAAREKGIDFVVHGGTARPVKGDRVLLERLAANLVDNAIRYTPPGGRVEIGLDEEKHRVVLTVRDSGIGIPKESLPLIFDRFYVVDPSRSKESGGSGLGLSIVKSVAEIHGAAIEVDSEPGRGTTFRIVFAA